MESPTSTLSTIKYSALRDIFEFENYIFNKV